METASAWVPWVPALIAFVAAVATAQITRRGNREVATVAPYEELAKRESQLTGRVNALEEETRALKREQDADRAFVLALLDRLPPELRPPPPALRPWLAEQAPAG